MGRGGILKLWKSLIALIAPPPLSHTAHLGWPRVPFNGRLHRCVGSRESVCTEGHVGRSEIPEGGGTEPHRALLSRLSVSLPPQSLPGPSLQEPLLAPDSSAAQPVLLVERDSSGRSSAILARQAQGSRFYIRTAEVTSHPHYPS